MNSLFARSVVALTTILISVGFAFVVITWWTTDRYYQEVTQRLNRTIADYIVAEKALINATGINQDALKDIAHMVMVINPSVEVYLIDNNGQVVGHALPDGAVSNPVVALAPIRRFLAAPERLPVFGDDPRNPGQQKVFSAAPVITPDGKTAGYLYAVLGGEKHLSAVRGLRHSLIKKVGLLAVAALIIFAVLTGLLVFYRLTRRLHHLAVRFNQFRDNGFTQALPIQHRRAHGDEIDDLAMTFNSMSQKIAEQMQALERKDLTRRELIQNVSHDLRTPLSSMQGYIDTLSLKFDELSDRQKREYLETAGRHGRHLGKLVRELFELARLDSGVIDVQREPFSMSELVQDIAQKFKLDAAKLGVSLSIDIDKSGSVVSADIGMLERVLENLLDNALKHSHPNGHVRVSLSCGQNTVLTTVVDDGAGISSEDLPRIFERTFVAAPDSGRRTSTGLGLAIVKRILDLHGSRIEVASKPGQGTAFSFPLQKATATTQDSARASAQANA